MTQAPEPRRRRILLADDNEQVQEVVRRLAERHGHTLIRVTTGATVTDTAIHAQPDVIVLDIGFPDADGRDILNSLKTDAKTAHIPVIVWSGRSGHPSDRRISLDLGAEDYVEKGDALLLLRKLERVLLRLDAKPL